MLQYHSHYDSSVLDGMSRISRAIGRAKDLGYKSLGITDHGTGQGLYRFYHECVKEGIKPILGVEAYMGEKGTNDRYHIILLAMNNDGLKNIYHLITHSYMDNFYEKPRITRDMLRQHSAGVIATSACLGSELARLFFDKKDKEAVKYVEEMTEIMGGRFFIEMQPNAMKEQVEYNKWLVKNFESTGKLTVNSDMHYVMKEDSYTHDTLIAMQVKKKKSDEKRFKFQGTDYYMMSHEEIMEKMSYIPAKTLLLALDNTEVISSLCNVSMDFGEAHMPKVDNDKSILAEMCNEGFKKRFHEGRFKGLNMEEVVSRIKYELKTICDKGYASYFIMVKDIMDFAEREEIFSGLGRGSVCGSEVAFILEIHDVEPISNGLLFERFLNPERNSMPDIDGDFCYEDRHKVISYIRSKYGAENTAHIVAEGRFTFKKALRDVMRTYDYTEQYINSVSKTMPDMISNLQEAVDKSEEFKKKLSQINPKAVEDMFLIEGLVSHNSKHAAGIVIAPGKIYDYVPCMRDSDDHTMLMTQWDKKEIEKAGLLKMDILGLKFLTILKKTLKNIEKNKGIKLVKKDLFNLSFNDDNVFRLMRSGNMYGIFQFEAPSAKAVVNKIQIENFEDVIAAESICRPGVKEADMYIQNKKLLREEGSFPTPSYWDKVKHILGTTYGAIIYQEQTMLIFKEIGSYTLGEADSLRKTKNLEEHRERFVSSAISKGFTEEEANELFNRFSLEYSFNKSHAAAYGENSYIAAYLKYYYPIEYMSAVLTLELTKQEPCVKEIIKEIRNIGINILTPDINSSTDEFIPVGNSILMPLNSIAGIGDSVIEAILANRPFSSFDDFLKRIPKKQCNKAKVKKLIKAGAFKSFVPNSSSLLEGYLKSIKDDEPVYFWCDEVQMGYEKECYGFYVTKHPLDGNINTNINDYKENDEITINCIVTDIRYTIDRKGNKMAFLVCENKMCDFEAIVFSSMLKFLERKIKLGNARLRGKVSGGKLLLNNVEAL